MDYRWESTMSIKQLTSNFYTVWLLKRTLINSSAPTEKGIPDVWLAWFLWDCYSNVILKQAVRWQCKLLSSQPGPFPSLNVNGCNSSYHNLRHSLLWVVINVRESLTSSDCTCCVVSRCNVQKPLIGSITRSHIARLSAQQIVPSVRMS